MEGCEEEVQKLVFDSGYFNKEKRELWYNYVQMSNRGAVLGLLLTLLPNLEIFIFDKYTWKARQFQHIVQRITKPCDRRSSATHKEGSRILTKLREVRFGGNDTGAYSEHRYIVEDFDLAGYFAKLPSMRKVHASPANVHSRQSNNSWVEVGSRVSNIDEISLKSRKLNATYISHCLSSLKNLRKFYYDDSTLRDGDRALDRDGAGTILRVLRKHAKTSLEFLSLAERESALKGSTSISMSLKQASLSCHLYAPAWKNDKKAPQGSAQDEKRPSDFGSDDSRPQKSKRYKASKLVEILPNSMEMIEFFGKVAIEHMEAMFQGLVEHRADRLPHLEEIVFHNSTHWRTKAGEETGKALQEGCSAVGIRLVLWKGY